MRVIGLKLATALLLVSAISACAPKRELVPSALTGGADEFGIVPSKTLESPTDFTSLPAPTPGGSNRTDVQPKADAIAALGGRLPTTGVDGGIVNYASRYGVDGAIRSELAQSDDKFLTRKTNAVRWPWTSARYERSYKRLALDPVNEIERLRALGIDVPSVPSTQ